MSQMDQAHTSHEAWGKARATLAISVTSLIGLSSAWFILSELYKYVEKEEVIEEEDLAAEAPGRPAGHAAAM